MSWIGLRLTKVKEFEALAWLAQILMQLYILYGLHRRLLLIDCPGMLVNSYLRAYANTFT